MRVVVVGQGPSGLLAADWLQRVGAEVVVCAASDGSLSLWSGGWDFRNFDAAGHPLADPWQWWSDPSHRDFASGWETGDWQIWWRALIRSWQAIGLLIENDPPRQNRWIVTPSGRVRPTFLPPPWQWTFASPAMEPAALISIESLLDSPVGWLKARHPELGWPAASVQLGRPKAWRAHWSGLAWAAFLDRSEGVTWLLGQLDQIQGRLPREGPIIFPQVLGLTTTESLIARISRVLRRPVFESALMPPAVGGIRIRDRWRRGLKSRGIGFLHGHVVKVSERGVHLAEGARRGDRLIEADAVVLATGGLVGGGLMLGTDGALTNSATSQGVPWGGEVEALASVGIGGGEGLTRVVGQQVGGSDPDRAGNGGAMTLWSVAQAVEAIMGPGKVNGWLAGEEASK